MDIKEILIIKNGKESYGISSSDINQIARVPMIMPLPLRPKGVRGLCAVSGNIVSMVDINILLEKNEVNYDDDKSRLLTLNSSFASSALLVPEVYNTLEIEDDKIDYIEKENDPIIAIYKYKEQLIQIISLEILFSKVDKVEIEHKEVKDGKTKIVSAKEEDYTRFLIFSMGNEKYAINIDFLREIILADISYTDIARSSDEVMGLITLRDELVIVIDLRKYYGFNIKNGYKNRILIATYNGKKIGLLIDEIIDIKNYLQKDVEYMDEAFKDNKIAGIIHEKNSLISFFDERLLERLFIENKSFIDNESNNIAVKSTEETALEVIIFKLLDKEYAFEVEKVAEIIDIIDSTKIAFTNNFIDGIINIRGQIVTIVSLFEKLNLPSNVNEDSKIIVCNINDSKIGFIVDSVSDILDIKVDEIREQDDEIFTNVFYLNNGKRLVLSMDINQIVLNKED